MRDKMTNADKALLEPYGEMISRIYEQIEASDHGELQALVNAASRSSSSNCWWATYKAAHLIAEIATTELRRRALQSGCRS